MLYCRGVTLLSVASCSHINTLVSGGLEYGAGHERPMGVVPSITAELPSAVFYHIVTQYSSSVSPSEYVT